MELPSELPDSRAPAKKESGGVIWILEASLLEVAKVGKVSHPGRCHRDAAPVRTAAFAQRVPACSALRTVAAGAARCTTRTHAASLRVSESGAAAHHVAAAFANPGGAIRRRRAWGVSHTPLNSATAPLQHQFATCACQGMG